MNMNFDEIVLGVVLWAQIDLRPAGKHLFVLAETAGKPALPLGALLLLKRRLSLKFATAGRAQNATASSGSCRE